MITLKVDLGDRSYPIYIGEGLSKNSELLLSHICGKQVLVVTNDVVAPLYLDRLINNLQGHDVQSIILPDGEKYKNLQSFENIITQLLQSRFSRNCTLIALGGGVIGDITGYVAASYQRGVPFIQIPTTLLAQVDSSVGGKTAVNHSLGKNMIGAFYQPSTVIADIETLFTLEDRQLKAGLAEVIKYGLIRDMEFYHWLDVHIPDLLKQDPASLIYAIERSCINKATVVADDERESGIRAILNLGHTFGHAIETAMQYEGWLHGEAVAAGMLMAARMSEKLGWIQADEVTRVYDILIKTGLPVELPNSVNAEQMLELMSVDKKAKDGRVFMILLKSIGHAIVTDSYTETILLETLREFES